MNLKLLLVILAFLSACTASENLNQKKNDKNKKTVKVLFCGDVMLDWGIKDIVNKKGPAFSIKYIKDFLHSFDYRFCNLECPITEQYDSYPEKKYVFRGDSKSIALLKNAEINCVSLANNHMFDMGKTGLINTIELLNSNNIAATGAGADITAARLPAVIDINGIKIAIFSYATNAYEDSYADKDIPGIASAKIENIDHDIKKYRSSFDFIIISIHWGQEYSEYPTENEIKLGHQIIESGADAIIGHHPHIFQGIEIYQEKPIFYSLGNFIFGSVNEDAVENILAKLTFMKDKIESITVFPINGNNNSVVQFQYKILEGEFAAKTLNHLKDISRPLRSSFSSKAAITGNSIKYTF